MSEATKDTIYIDIDDEITGIIDKVRGSKHKIVALVLPKRATTLQSIVNMKLLKRTATDSKKNLVLITSETSLLPLAGAVGLHVAKNLQTKPAIPAVPTAPDEIETIAEAEEPLEAPDTAVDATKPVGELAGLPSVAAEEVIQIDNTNDGSEKVVGAAAAKTAKKNKKLKVPNFEKFRLRLVLAGLALIALITGWYTLFYVLPKAKVTIQTDNTSITSTLSVTLDTAAETLDEAGLIVPAEYKEFKKTTTEKVAATGQKDVGTKASGTVTIINCTDNPIKISAGTGVSSGSLTYILQSSVSMDAGDFTSGGQCKSNGDHVDSAAAIAQNNGDQYNIPGRTLTIAGVSGDVRATTDGMSGGTSKKVTIVSGQDVETAKQKLTSQDTTEASEELEKQFEAENLYGITETVVAGTPTITASPAIDQEGSEVTVTAVTTYTMFGAMRDDLKKLVENDAKKQIDTAKQKLLSDGIDEAVFSSQSQNGKVSAKIQLQTTVAAGAEINPDDIKQYVAGKKRGEAENYIKDRPGVKDVTISYSPFYVLSTPKKTSQISVVIEQINGNGEDTSN